MTFLRKQVRTITPGAASDRFFMGLLVIVDVRTVAGGMNAWLAAGLPAARCAPPRRKSAERVASRDDLTPRASAAVCRCARAGP